MSLNTIPLRALAQHGQLLRSLAQNILTMMIWQVKIKGKCSDRCRERGDKEIAVENRRSEEETRYLAD
jgi:hypothetical protein